MKPLRIISIIALALVAVLIVALFSSCGFFGGTQSDNANNNDADVTVQADSPQNDESTSSAQDASEPSNGNIEPSPRPQQPQQPEQPFGAVYVITSQREYQAGQLDAEYISELDSSGNLLFQRSRKRENTAPPDSQPQWTWMEWTQSFSGYDEKGCCAKSSFDGMGRDIRYNYEFDEQGRLVTETDSDGYVTNYFYYENGALGKAEHTTDPNVRISENPSLTGFDLNGYIVSQSSLSNPPTSYAWSFDGRGYPVSCTITTGDSVGVYSVETDVMGNITRVLDSAGQVYREYEYALVGTPSDHVKTFSRLKRI